MSSSIFFFNDTAPTEIYTLSLHDALPISDEPELVVVVGQEAQGLGQLRRHRRVQPHVRPPHRHLQADSPPPDRKSTRLNSSHANISYAVFCLKKKTTIFNSADLQHPLTLI